MKTIIGEKLEFIEKQENCRILLAVESGSRAWGFPSENSDYDVRFIYVRPLQEYLKLQRGRDVIEISDGGLLDIAGWDLDKTLRLVYKSNPTVMEWLSSPVVYRTSDEAGKLKEAARQYFSVQKELRHYFQMAKNHYDQYCDQDSIILKKIFYVLRPILACRWIIKKKRTCPRTAKGDGGSLPAGSAENRDRAVTEYEKKCAGAVGDFPSGSADALHGTTADPDSSKYFSVGGI